MKNFGFFAGNRQGIDSSDEKDDGKEKEREFSSSRNYRSARLAVASPLSKDGGDPSASASVAASVGGNSRSSRSSRGGRRRSSSSSNNAKRKKKKSKRLTDDKDFLSKRKDTTEIEDDTSVVDNTGGGGLEGSVDVEKQGNGDDDNNSNEKDDDDDHDDDENNIKLYKSPRLKGYITLCFASSINYNAAAESGTIFSFNSSIPATLSQQQYAMAVSMVSIILTAATLICHFDRITALERVWRNIVFKKNSKFELALILFLVVWWSIAVGIETTILGICGDGKGQYSLYYSAWASCLCSYSILESWWVDYGWASFKSFISSWPNRAPVWLCLMLLSLFTMIWYVDLYKNHDKLTRESEQVVAKKFESVPSGQWDWLIAIAVLTLMPAIGFVLIELFRDIRPDGTNEKKSGTENTIEGIIFFVLALAWIPSVCVATTPGGIASLIGNAYFSTWLLVVFLFEGLVWWIHDYRVEIHQALREKANEYKQHQRQVLQQTNNILGRREEEENRRRRADEEDDSDSEENEIGLSEPITNGGDGEDGRLYEPNDIEEFLREDNERDGEPGSPHGQFGPADDDEFYDAVEGG